MRLKALRGDRLRQERERQGLTQQQLGERINTGVNQINRYENGIADPLPYQLKHIAKELQVTTDYLLGLVDGPHGHLQEQTLTAHERKFLAALRQGELRTLLRLIDQTLPEQDEPADISRLEVTIDEGGLEHGERSIPD